ncbi:hypothetical protein HYPSUDRAFT_1088315, partial [Hypholoma sublateritium FD-334 SS-4]
GRTRIPALKKRNADGNITEAQDNSEKSRILHKMFFYDQPTDTGIDENFQYQEPAFQFRYISDNQIKRVAKQLNPYKAPGLNDISNAVLTHCSEQLAPYLGPIYRATFSLEHYPDKWKRYETVVLRKPGKPDYKEPSAYRPIALLDVIAKLLSACVKETL